MRNLIWSFLRKYYAYYVHVFYLFINRVGKKIKLSTGGGNKESETETRFKGYCV